MTTEQLNQLLAQELGRNQHGEGIFSWRISDDCFWPASATGRKIKRPIKVPIIGTDQFADAEELVAEYKPMRQSFKLRKQWVVTRWFSPAMLVGLHLDFKVGTKEPDVPHEMILAQWRKSFPDAEFPARGVHLLTDYYNKPGVQPGLDDTRFFIHQVREQFSGMSAKTRLIDMEKDEEAYEAKKTERTYDAVENCFTAFLNIPGKRGTHVSFGGSDLQEKGAS